MTNWTDLSRTEQRYLERLYGGGSLRDCDPAIIARLKALGLIEFRSGRERLSDFGSALMAFIHAELRARMTLEKPRADAPRLQDSA
jgi:hypothetical protein